MKSKINKYIIETSNLSNIKQRKELADIICRVRDNFTTENVNQWLYDQTHKYRRGKAGLTSDRKDEPPPNELVTEELKQIRRGGGKRARPVYFEWLIEEYPELIIDLIEDIRGSPEALRANIARHKSDVSAEALEDSAPLIQVKSIEPQPANSEFPHGELRQQFTNYQHRFLADYEPHDIEAVFRLAYEIDDCGYWLLKAGPGMGKSSVIASLAKRAASRGPSIFYIFRDELDGSERNKKDTFQKYIVESIREHFPTLTLPQQGSSSFSEYFRALLVLLNRENHISRTKPLFIYVDALDEMEPDESHVRATNPLGFPEFLPPGVFVTASIRRVGNEKGFYTPLPSGHRVIGLETDEQRTRQINTVKRYVFRVCSENSYIAPFTRGTALDAQTQRKNREFVDRITKKANFNFMILRSVLHDESYWSEGGTGIDLVSELSDYYEWQFARMTRSERTKTGFLSAYCFGIDSTISLRTVLLLLEGHDQSEIENLLDSWIAQGLVLKDESFDETRLRAYHKTFRDFLLVEIHKQDRASVIVPFLDKLEHGLLQIAFSADPDDGDGDLYTEWLRLALTLADATKRFGTLKRLLTDKRSWTLVHRSKRSYSIIFTQICRVEYTENSMEGAENFLREVARFLVGWESENKGILKAVQDSCAHDSAAKGLESSLDLYDFVRAEMGIEDDW